MKIFPQNRFKRGRIVFRSALAFYAGCALIVTGVALHLPMFFQASSMHYMLAGMPMPPEMIIGMLAIVVGLFVVAYGVTPPVGEKVSADQAHGTSYWSVRALDDAPLSKEHWKLILVLGIALVIDIMKPASLAFTLPGMRTEYGIDKVTVVLQPFSALIGLVVGSFLWGWFGDRVGRRATILFAAIMFMATSICGTMPSFGWNMFMCFMMGLSAGGLLPIAVALLSEILPVRSRAPFVVLLGGIGAAGGFLFASWAATELIPTYSWRVMWLLNLPTGALLLLLNRFIPESPRFLLGHGRVQEASVILKQFGARIEPRAGGAMEAPVPRSATPHVGTSAIFKAPYLPRTLAIALYASSWGLVNYGFNLWLPTNLQDAGFGEQAGNAILAKSALIALPGVVLIAWLYWKWSSKKTMMLASILTTASILAFLPLSHGARDHTSWLAVTVIALLVSSAGMAATMSPYAAEVYPTSIRTTGSGLAAGGGKFGGLAGQGAVLAHVAPTLAVAAPLVAIPVALATVVLGMAGRETRGRRLEETSNEVIGLDIRQPDERLQLAVGRE